MVTAVLVFALLTAILEALLLYRFCSLKTLNSKSMPWIVHFIVVGINLAIHWGTIVGTMTAITAALVSFAVYPAVIWLKTFVVTYRTRQPL